jgi:hypothetical protein
VRCGPSGYGGGMTQPGDTAPVLDGTDVSADPADLDTPPEATDVPATSDPEQMTDDDLGGVAGQGGAG